MKERLLSSDYRFMIVCLALFAGTTWFSVHNFYRAFPEASIDFRVGRDDAQALAGRFLTGRGYRTRDYRQASSFSFDDQAKTFLEREAGLEQANRIMGSRVRLWRWSYRWFRPQQKEEFRVDITPRGELAGFEHLVPEDAPAAGPEPAPPDERARSLAEDFLRTALGRDPASLEFVEVSSVARPKRTDRVFTWKERDFNLHGATIRLEVTVLGGEIGGYREYLKIPEQWTRDYERLRSKNEMAQTIDSAVLLLLVAGLVVVIVIRVRRQDVRWRRAALIGTVGVALAFCASLNEFPLREFGYPTTDSYGSFLTRELLQATMSALAAGGLLFVLTAAAEPLYREAFPGKIGLANLFRLRGLRTKRFFLGALLGIALTGIFVAYQTAFYIVAYRYGAWSPADVPYSDLLNTRFPWLFVLFGGFLPAVSEEFLFRMFGIPFLRKLVRSTAVAVVLAGFIWGFGHAGYPQQPFYIRGVEVGIGGVALGLVMLRWGILPTLVWHYSVDAMYGAMLLVRSHNLYYRLSGAASAGILVVPVLVALVAYWRRGGFEPETGLLNRDDAAPAGEEAAAGPEGAPGPEAAAEPKSVPDAGYRPLGARWRLVAAAILALGLLALLIPVSRFGESPGYKLTGDQARAASDAFLRARGLDPSGFRHVTYPAVHWSEVDSVAGKYFLERRPVSFVSRLFERYRPVHHWVTRYFKSLDVEGAFVSVHPETGKVLGFSHQIPEDRAGADVSAEAARQTASVFAGSQGWDLASMDLKESRSEMKKARRDYTLVWETRPGDARALDEARYRLEIGVAGDRVSAFQAYWKIPESFSRARSRENWISITVLALRVGVMAAAVILALLLLIQNTRKGLVRWRPAIWLALPPAILTAAPLLSIQLRLRNYDTAIPFETFQALTYTALLMSLIAAFLMFGAATALVTSYYPESVAALRAGNRRWRGADAAACVLAATGMHILASRFSAVLMDRFHAQALFSFGSPDLVASAAPAVEAIAGAVRSTVFYAAVLAVIALVVQRTPRRWMLFPLGLAAAFALLPSEIHTPGEFAVEYAAALVAAGCAALFCWRFARDNYLAYALVLWLMMLRRPLMELFGSANPALQTQGWIVAGVLAASFAWALYPALTRRAEAATD